MIIEFLFATVLDMSLPEFQPEVDLSGNYIVGTYDVSSDEVIVEEVPAYEVPIEEPGGSLRGLSPEPVPEDNTKNEVNILRSVSYLEMQEQTQRNLNVSTRTLIFSSNTANFVYYIPLSSGVTYNISCTGACIIFDSLERNSVGVLFTSGDNYTPSYNQYVVCQSNQTLYVYVVESSGDDTSGNEPGDDTSGNEPGDDTSGNEPGDDTSGNEPSDDTSGNEPGGNITADLTAVENKLDRLIVLLRSVLLVSAVSFLYPLIISVFNNIGGGKNV